MDRRKGPLNFSNGKTDTGPCHCEQDHKRRGGRANRTK